MSTKQIQAGIGKKRKPRRNDSPTAAPKQEGRGLSPTSVYPNGHDNGGQTASDTKSAGILVEQTGPEDGGTETHAKAIGAEFQDQDYLIDIKEVMRRTGLCRGSIYYLLETSDFPLPVEMGQRIKRWWSGEINQWMKALPRAKGDLGKWHSQVDDPGLG